MRPFHPHRLWGALQFFNSEKFWWHNSRAAGGRDGGGKVDDLSVLGDFFAELSSAISKDLSPDSSHIVAWTRRRWTHAQGRMEDALSSDRSDQNGRSRTDAVTKIYGERYLAEYSALLDGSAAMRTVRVMVENIADTDDHGPAPWRERGRQGSRRPRHPRRLTALQWPVHQGQLR